jgi:ATP-binding cassette subfamily C protein LapB
VLYLLFKKKEGLDYLVLEGGVGFSGGQNKLIIARLLIRQPNILLLDEPTAALMMLQRNN